MSKQNFDKQMITKTYPTFKKPKEVIGNNIIFRDALKEDATFILGLRTDPKKAKYISKTSNNLMQQEAFLEKYSKDSEQVYIYFNFLCCAILRKINF